MKKLLMVMTLVMLTCFAFAQLVSEYGMVISAGSYTPITGGTSLGDTAIDDQRFVDPAVPLGGTTTTGVGFPIGFDFTYAGVVFNRLAINANGWISLGQSALTPAVNIASTSAYTPIGSTTAITPTQLVSRIAPFARDLQAQVGATLLIETIGTAPNRELVVQWTNYRKYGATGDNYNFQIRLQENGNKVAFVYGTMINNASAGTAQVGLRGEPAITATNWYTFTTTTSWTAPTASATNTATMTITSAVFPPSGTTYLWTPPVAGMPPNPASIVSPANGGTNVSILATLNWASGGGVPTGYKLSFGTVSPFTTVLNEVDMLAVTTYDPELVYSTEYWWKVIPYNANGSAADCPTWTFTTMADPTVTVFPYTESFDVAVPPTGWTNLATVGTISWYWQATGTFPTCAPYSGAGMASYNSFSSSAGNKAILTTPPINLPSDDYRLNFYMYRDIGYSTSADLVNVYYNTTNSATGATLLGTVNRAIGLAPVVATEGWYAYTFAMPAGAAGNGRYIIFEAVSAYGNNMFIDQVTVEQIPAGAVLSVNPTSWNFGSRIINTTVTKDFTLTNTGGGTLSISSIVASGAPYSIVTNPAPVDLTAGQSAVVTVRYLPTAVGTFEGSFNITDNRAVTNIPLSGTCFDPTISVLPYTQDFETWPPAGWDLTGGTYSFTQYTDATPNNWAKANFWGQTSGNTDVMTTPPVFTTDPARLRFTWSHLFSSTYPLDALTVQVSSDMTNWTSVWMKAGADLDSFDGAGSTTPGTGVVETVNIPMGFIGSNFFVRFYAYSGYGPDLYIDNVIIEDAPAGAPNHVNLLSPANLATGVDPTNCVLTWAEDSAGAPAVYYEIFVGEEPIDPANDYYGEFGYESHDGTSLVLSDETDIELAYDSRWYWAVLPHNGGGAPDPLVGDFEVFQFTISSPPPQISVDPLALTSTIDFGETDLQTITITNDGGLPLNYSIGLVDESGRRSAVLPVNQYVSRPVPFRAEDSDKAPFSWNSTIENSRALFDVQFAYNCALADGEYGIATDGDFFYTSKWSSPAGGLLIRKYAMDGTYISDITIAGANGIRDIAYDGTYFYGSPVSNLIYQMDFTTGTLVSTITAPAGLTIRAITYDSEQDAFWCGMQWNADLRLIDRTGAQIQTLVPAVASMGGIAYDNISGDVPTLWLNTQTGAALNVWVQINITTGAIIQSYDMGNSTVPPIVNASAGGAFLSTSVVPGYATLIGMMQNYKFVGLELCETVNWAVPTPRTGTVAAGASAVVDVTFNGIDNPPGVYAGHFLINNNAGDPVVVDLDLNIQGDWIPIFGINPTAWNFGDVEQLNPSTKNFTITNTGGPSLIIGANDIYLSDNAEGNFALVTNNLPVTLGNNETYTFTVNFTPQTLGAKTATLNIEDNLAARVINSVPLSGTGIEEPIGQVVNLQASVIANENVNLTWALVYGGGGEPGWLHYDDGINVDGIGTGAAATFNVAIKYSSGDLWNYGGMEINKIKFYPKSANTNYTLRVWTGSDIGLTPTTLVYEQAVVAPTIDAWNEVILNTPVPIAGNEAMWIGYYNDVTVIDAATDVYHPAGCDAGPAMVGYGDVIELGGTWYSMMTQWALNYNWNLQAYVDEPAIMAAAPTMLNVPVVNNTRNLDLRNVRLSTASGNTTSRVLRGFNVYRDAVMINSTLVTTNTYLDEMLSPDTYSYTVQAMYYSQNSAMSDPVEATILPPVPIALPFLEDWASSSFVTNQWVSGGTNWSVVATTGVPAPSAQFSWAPQATNYSIPLTSYLFDGATFPALQLSFDLGLNNYSFDALNTMSVQVWTAATNAWTNVHTYTNLDYPNFGSTDWGTFYLDISAYAANQMFKIRFLAEGENSYEINQWYIDNIAIAAPIASLDTPENFVVAPDPDGLDFVLLTWDEVADANWYGIYVSSDPYGTYEYIGYTTELSVYIQLYEKHFFKVTAGAGAPPDLRNQILNPVRAAKPAKK